MKYVVPCIKYDCLELPYSLFAAEMSDPYDATKSWSVNEGDVEVDTDNGGSILGKAATESENGQLRDPFDKYMNPQYMYDNCAFTEEGAILINGEYSGKPLD